MLEFITQNQAIVGLLIAIVAYVFKVLEERLRDTKYAKVFGLATTIFWDIEKDKIKTDVNKDMTKAELFDYVFINSWNQIYGKVPSDALMTAARQVVAQIVNTENTTQLNK